MEIQEQVGVALDARIELCHAALQHLADRHEVDLLHLKGLAFRPRWRSRAGGGSDADVLVRPSHVRRFLRAIEAAGWHRRSRFHTGSPFGHAQTYWHDHLGYADVHRFFPGMAADEGTFDVLWAGRDETALAAVGCPVPDEPAQALIFMLNETRNGPGPVPAARLADLDGTPLGEAVAALVPRVGAQVAHAAATGRLDDVRDRREHDLWRAITTGSGRVEEWRARVKAQPRFGGKVLTVLRAPLVNTEHLTNIRGRRPSPGEIATEFVHRARRAVVEVRAARRPGGGS